MQVETIKQYALEQLCPGDMDADQACHELKTLLETRISDGLAGKVSAKGVGEILDEEPADGRG
jgi:Antitoxin ParD